LVGVVILCGFYEWLSYRQHTQNPSDTTIPNLSQLWNGLKQSCSPRTNPFGKEGETFSEKLNTVWLYKDSYATYSRLIKGLGWGCLLSTVLGIIMGCYYKVASFLLPVLSLLAKTPGTAMLAVFFVLVGTGEMMFVSMIGFGVLPTLTQAVYLAAKHDVHDESINKAYTLGASSFEVIWNVVFRQILPKVLENIRLQIGPAMVYLIAAEMLVGQVGMGYQIRMQQRLLNMAVVYDYLIILSLTGLLMDKTMLFTRQIICPWYEPT
jgi:ABC-type nitrate/sulfonate/bicarbonate transport system permease component